MQKKRDFWFLVATMAVLFVSALVIGILAGSIKGKISQSVASRKDALRDNHYWASEEGDSTMMDLRLYLEDHGCQMIRTHDTEHPADTINLNYTFIKDGASFRVETELQRHIDAEDSEVSTGEEEIYHTITRSRVVAILPDGSRLETDPKMAEYPTSQPVHDTSSSFVASRACLGQLFYIIQNGAYDPEVLPTKTAELAALGINVSE